MRVFVGIVLFSVMGSFAMAATDPHLTDVQDKMMLEFSDECQPRESWMPAAEVHTISFKPDSSSPMQDIKLYQIFCSGGAYNFSYVYYFREDTGIITPLSFSEPVLNGLKIIGFITSRTLVNSAYDPATQSISFFAKWRGVGDASSAGVYKFNPELIQFVLKAYEVDNTYDGKYNSTTILNY